MAELRAPDGGSAIRLIAQVQEADSRREADLRKIASTRRYVLKNKRWERDAVMNVRVTYESGVGKHFEIISMENADGLQKRVFDKLLEGEMEASRKDSSNVESGITLANYDFTFVGEANLNGRECLLLQLKPKRNSKYLIEGKAWVDAKEHAIVRVEGRTAKSVSFWIGKPYIVQNFRKVDDVWLSASNQSTSDVKLIGKTELTVDFIDYQLGRQPEIARSAQPSGK